MEREETGGKLAAAAGRLRQVRERLMQARPAEEEALALDLDGAAALLKELAAPEAIAALRGDRGLAAAAHAIQQELKVSAALLRQAQAFHDMMLRLACLAAGGYTAEGAPRQFAPRPRLSLDA